MNSEFLKTSVRKFKTFLVSNENENTAYIFKKLWVLISKKKSEWPEINNLIMHPKVLETWDQDKAPKQQVARNTIRIEINEKEETKRLVGRISQTSWCSEEVSKTDELVPSQTD